MNFAIIASVMSAALLSGCAGSHGGGAGWGFHFIFIVIPLFIVGFLVLKRIESISDSLYTIEGQLKKLSGRIDSLEEKLNRVNAEEKTSEPPHQPPL